MSAFTVNSRVQYDNRNGSMDQSNLICKTKSISIQKVIIQLKEVTMSEDGSLAQYRYWF